MNRPPLSPFALHVGVLAAERGVLDFEWRVALAPNMLRRAAHLHVSVGRWSLKRRFRFLFTMPGQGFSRVACRRE